MAPRFENTATETTAMSSIMILNQSDTTYATGNRCFMVEMESGKHNVIVLVHTDYVQVVVQNAMNRAWRGMGKHYRNAAEAIGAYKTAAIRSMIEHAVELAGGQK